VTRREDPHRVLGLARDAPMAEVKRAYRLLAKRHHPDAGDGSVERFLEVQAAYEVLARGEVAGTSRSGSARTPGRRSAQPGSRAAGAGRAGSERSDEGGAPPPPGSGWAGRPAGAARHAGSGQAGDRWRGRDPQKATLGSTTYDGAGATAEPTWDGADWYGRASGTYWTMNPREYADPRKHGPEYQARTAAARLRGADARPIVERETGPAGEGRGPAPERAAALAARRGRDTPAAAWGTSGAGAGEGRGAGDARGAGAAPHPGPAAVRPAPAALSGQGAAPGPGPGERLVVAVLGWLPFGLLLATAASAPGGLIATLPLQAAGLVGMLGVPRLAWASAGGLAAVVAFTIPGVAALSALGVPVRPGGPAPIALVILAAAAWCAGALVASSGRFVAVRWRARP
jgi:hypothetical protein